MSKRIQTNTKNKGVSNKNAGFTLVEVIVSIIILAIIILPLLQNFVIAAKTNGKARKEQYAVSLAQSVMEGVKEFSVEEAALQFFSENTDFYLVNMDAAPVPPAPTPTYYQVDYTDPSREIKLNDSDSSVIEVGTPKTKKFVTNSNGTYSYVIKNVKEGVETFDVLLRYDASRYTGKDDGSVKIEQNTYEIPKVEALDANTLALIEPFAVFRSFDATGDTMVLNNTYDERVKEYYYQVHQSYITAQWNAACAVVAKENSNRLKAWQDAGSIGAAPTMESYPPKGGTKTLEQIVDYIQRTMEITIETVGTKKKVNCKLLYTINASDTTIFPQGTPNREYDLYYGGMEFYALKGVYVFYPPFTDNFSQETVLIKSLDGIWSDAPNFFFAIQSDVIDASASLPISLHPIDTSVKLYSQMKLKVDGDTRDQKQLVLKNEASNRMFDITVEVYESGTNFGNLLAQITSSVRE